MTAESILDLALHGEAVLEAHAEGADNDDDVREALASLVAAVMPSEGSEGTAAAGISDAEAREIAQRWTIEDRADALDRFAEDGSINGELSLRISWRWRTANSEHRAELDRLQAYVSHHGERGPQTSSYVVTVTTPQGCDCRPGLDGSGYRHELDCASRKPAAERHPVDTLDKLKATVFNLVAAALPPVTRMGSKRVNPAMDEFGPKAIDLADAGTGSLELPNGDTITVSRVPDWGER